MVRVELNNPSWHCRSGRQVELNVVDELARRRALSFKQAEGLEPLPSQLNREEVSRQLRSLCFNAVHRMFVKNLDRNGWIDFNSGLFKFLEHKHYYIDHGYENDFDAQSMWIDITVSLRKDNYPDFFETIQQLCRADSISEHMTDEISEAFLISKSPYRIIEGTLIPFGTEFEASAYLSAIAAVPPESGVRKHLRGAATALNSGYWADCVRESMHAVESMSRQITGADSLSSALNQLARAGHIHSAMNEGFKRLYGYTSDQSGIRHALLDDGDARVTEADAMFMLGACASFVTYLSVNARTAGLLGS